MIWGAISLSAAAGFAAVHLESRGRAVLLSERPAAASGAVEVEAVPVSGAPADVALAVPDAAEQILWRACRGPRPERPIFTGSISRVGGSAGRASAIPIPAPPGQSGLPFRITCVQEHRTHPYYRYPRTAPLPTAHAGQVAARPLRRGEYRGGTAAGLAHWEST